MVDEENELEEDHEVEKEEAEKKEADDEKLVDQQKKQEVEELAVEELVDEKEDEAAEADGRAAGHFRLVFGGLPEHQDSARAQGGWAGCCLHLVDMPHMFAASPECFGQNVPEKP